MAGHLARPLNDWGDGNLPAPWAEGDLVERINDNANERLRGDIGQIGEQWVVVSVFSIDKGDAWYCRVARASGGWQNSDRLHVAFAARSTFDADINWMSSFRLLSSGDRWGIGRRAAMIADGWTFNADTFCPACGHDLTETGET